MLPYNAIFLNALGAPAPASVPNLRVGPRGFERNFTFDDIDGDGRLDLIVSAVAPGKGPGKADIQAYSFANDLQGSAELKPLNFAAPLPDDCPMPLNTVRAARLDPGGFPAFVCLRPGTIDVRAAASPGQFGTVVRSEFALVEDADGELYPWAIGADLADVTGDGRPDYVNTAFPSQIWYRPNLGNGRFGPMELTDVAAMTDAGGSDLGLAYALDVAPLPPPPGSAGQPHAFAFSNGYAPGEAPSAGSITLLKFPVQNLDHDGDGVADLLDNCPSLPNPDQTDANNNKVGDACDNTKCGTDDDGDKITNVITSDDPSCATDKVDNCPTRPNSDQRNGNIAAEDANGAARLGDACDPVPHATPIPLWNYTGTPKPARCGTPSGGGPLVCLPEGLGYRSLSGIRVTTVGQHPASEIATKPEGSVSVPRTNFRLCLERLDGTSDTCAPSAYQTAALIDSTAPIRALEVSPSAAAPWRRLAIDGLSAPAPGGTLPQDGTWRGANNNGQLYGPNATFPQRAWAWNADLTAWQNSFGAAYPFGGIEDLDATLAIQAETTAGMVAGDPFGLHPTLASPTQPAKNLAVGTVKIEGVSFPYFRLFPKASEWRARPIPSLVQWLPLSGTACSQPSDLCRTTQPRSAIPLYRHPVSDFIGIVDEDGAIREVGDALPATVRELLASSALVLAPSEPSDDVGGRRRAPSLVALTQDAGTIQARLAMTDGVLNFPRDGCGEALCGPIGARRATPAGTPTSPAVAVYAASLEIVFRLRGGTASELSFQSLTGDGEWTTLTPSQGPFGRIAAATYNAFEGRLWVLDEVGQGLGRSFRLLRVAPFDGSFEEIGRFPRFGLFDTHWLVSDHDGGMLLAASSSILRRHTIVRMHAVETDAKRRLEVDDVYGERGELLAPPRVSPAGVAMVVQDAPNKVPAHTSYPQLPGGKGAWHHLGACF